MNHKKWSIHLGCKLSGILVIAQQSKNGDSVDVVHLNIVLFEQNTFCKVNKACLNHNNNISPFPDHVSKMDI